jgi:hypothetical protein
VQKGHSYGLKNNIKDRTRTAGTKERKNKVKKLKEKRVKSMLGR